MRVIEIKNRHTGALLYSGEHKNLKDAVESAVKAGVSLAGANLRYTDLRGANLEGVNLCDADLRYTELHGTDMHKANLQGANLEGAGLARANLHEANLRDTTLYYAYMFGAELADADMRDAKVGQNNGETTLVGPRPVVQIGPIGPKSDWMMVFCCGGDSVRVSIRYLQQITEDEFLYFFELAPDGDEPETGEVSDDAKHYLDALAFAKRLLLDQQKNL